MTPTPAPQEPIDPAEYLAGLSDAELNAAADEAMSDLQEAAAQQNESEWHEQCFAAVILFGMELKRRGIDRRTMH